MSSPLLDRVLATARDAQGTRLEPVRNGLLGITKYLTDGLFALERKRSTRPVMHPLSRVIASQVGDPFERWNMNDVANFRSQFEGMLDYLPSNTMCTVTESHFEHDDQKIRYRLFTPPRARNDLVVLYLHGGGFVLGAYDSNDPECDAIARGCGAQVFSLDYPLSPEHRYPVAVDLLGNMLGSEEFADGRRYILIGESAGGNLAASMIENFPDVQKRCVRSVLVYPILDLSLSGQSVDELASGYFLTKCLLKWFVLQYLGETGDSLVKDPKASPLFGDVGKLPPTLGIVGEFDPLRSDLERLGQRGHQVQIHIVEGVLHGFLQLRGLSSERSRALHEIIQFINTS